MNAPAPAPRGVDLRRPGFYLAVGAVLALLSLLLPALDVSGAGPTSPPPPVAGSVLPPSSSTPDCPQPAGSLRPTGPLPAPGAMPAGSTMAAIAARGRLVVGVDQGKYLLGYRNPLNGQLAGSDIDLARQIAAAILGDPNKIQYVVQPIADRARLVERGQVDMVINSFTVTCARQRTVEFSSPYFAASQRVLIPVGTGITRVEQLRGQRVCTSTGATNEAVLRNLGLDLDVVTMSGIPDCVVALQQGKVAAVSSDDVILAGQAAQDPQTRVLGGPALASTAYAVGMSPRQPDLVRFVNALLERDRANGSLARSEKRWLGGQLRPVPPVPAARYRD